MLSPAVGITFSVWYFFREEILRDQGEITKLSILRKTNAILSAVIHSKIPQFFGKKVITILPY